MIPTREDSALAAAVASALRHTPRSLRARHLAEKFENLAERLMVANARPVHPATDAKVKARILAAVEEALGPLDEDQVGVVYETLIVLDSKGFLTGGVA